MSDNDKPIDPEGNAQPEKPADDWGAPAESAGSATTDAVRVNPAFVGDRYFYRVVAWSLALAAVLSLIGGVALAGTGKEVPHAIVAIGSTAIGALAGVVAGSGK